MCSRVVLTSREPEEMVNGSVLSSLKNVVQVASASIDGEEATTARSRHEEYGMFKEHLRLSETLSETRGEVMGDSYDFEDDGFHR